MVNRRRRRGGARSRNGSINVNRGVASSMVTQLAKGGRNVPDCKSWVCCEDSVDVPCMVRCDENKWTVTRQSPSSDILPAFFKRPSQFVGNFLVEAVQGIAVHVVSHFRLVYVARSRFLGVPENLIRNLRHGENVINIKISKVSANQPPCRLPWTGTSLRSPWLGSGLG